jgi:hypothetical protein
MIGIGFLMIYPELQLRAEADLSFPDVSLGTAGGKSGRSSTGQEIIKVPGLDTQSTPTSVRAT